MWTTRRRQAGWPIVVIASAALAAGCASQHSLGSRASSAQQYSGSQAGANRTIIKGDIPL